MDCKIVVRLVKHQVFFGMVARGIVCSSLSGCPAAVPCQVCMLLSTVYNTCCLFCAAFGQIASKGVLLLARLAVGFKEQFVSTLVPGVRPRCSLQQCAVFESSNCIYCDGYMSHGTVSVCIHSACFSAFSRTRHLVFIMPANHRAEPQITGLLTVHLKLSCARPSLRRLCDALSNNVLCNEEPRPSTDSAEAAYPTHIHCCAHWSHKVA